MGFSSLAVPASLGVRVGRLLARGRQPHAMLYAGEAGSAALPMALCVAHSLLCSAPQAGSACGTCASCRANAQGQHPDLHFFFPIATLATASSSDAQDGVSARYQAAWRAFLSHHPYGGLVRWRSWLQQQSGLEASADKGLQIGREQMRRLLQEASLTPYMGRSQVILIWLPELFHSAAGNAFLKTLEAPQPRTYFLLVSHRPQQLLPTLRSRAPCIQVPLPSPELLAEWLVAHLNTEQEKALTCARRAAGHVDQAQSLAQGTDLEEQVLLQDWLRACWVYKTEWILKAADAFAGYSRFGQRVFLYDALHVLRQVLLEKTASELRLSLETETEAFVRKFARSVSLELLAKLVLVCDQMLLELEGQAHPKMLFMAHTLAVADAFLAARRATL